MQQRRGTAAQWAAANPILAAGEIGFETDTSKFKMGNGSSAWGSLTYFANAAELTAIIDGAPDLLNTLNELAAAIGDDPSFFTNVGDSIADNIDLHNVSTDVHGIANTALLATTANVATALTAAETFAGNAITTHNADISDVHGIANTSELATKTYADTAVSTHQADTSEVHGIADTLALATKTYADTAVQTHSDDVENVHGIANTVDLATKTYADTAVSTHSDDTLGVHGIDNTADLATKTYADTAVSTHAALTEDVHGIADTSLLATQDYVDTAVGNSAVNQSLLAGVGIAYNEATDQFDIDSTVATTTYVGTEIGTHNSATTNVHGISDAANLVYTSDSRLSDERTPTNLSVTTGKIADAAVTGVKIADNAISQSHLSDDSVGTNELGGLSVTTGKIADEAVTTAKIATGAVTKSMVGLANVDNTTDASKPVSTATQTALDLKANLANPTFTGTVTSTGALVVEGNLTVSGTTTTVNAADLSITDPLIYLASNQYDADLLDVGFMAATGAPGGTQASHLHSGFFRDASDSKKWKLVSNVPHPVNNVVDVTNATRETLVVGSLEATTVTPSSGVVFTDGTQTKEGTPSRTYIYGATNSNGKAANYTLSSLAERDSLIEVSAAATITIPTDATLNYPIGTSIDILQTGTGAVVIAPVSGTVTVNATPGLTLRTQWSSATLFKRAANTWVVYGDLK